MNQFLTLLGIIGLMLTLSNCGGSGTGPEDNGSANQRPVAVACCSATVEIGARVSLDASQSSDADQDSLTYHWTLSLSPQDSQASLNDSASVQPAFTADKAGLYRLELVVHDGQVNSDTDRIDITAQQGNIPPVANAGPDQQVGLGAQVQLDGSASSDANQDALLYTWVLLNPPPSSSASLSLPDTVSPSLQPDVFGYYVIELTVDDQQGGISSDQVVIYVVQGNSPPQANAGADQNATTGNTLTLHGRQSFDSDLDPLSYLWSFVSRPSGSQSALSDPSSATPVFTPDRVGDYVVSLVVNDGAIDSAPDSVVVHAYDPFVVTGLGVNFAPYDANTHYAGDFIFGCTDAYKVFIEFGAIVNAPADPQRLVTFDYILPMDTAVHAVADGEVIQLCWQSTTTEPPDAGLEKCDNLSWDAHDYEITVLLPGNPSHDVNYDHVTDPQVRIGDWVNAGDIIGYPGISSHTCEEFGGSPLLGRSEISITDYTENKAVCPFVFFDPATKSTYEAQVTQMMSDWEQYVFDTYGINGDYEANSVKAEQVYDEANHVMSGCYSLDTSGWW